MPALALLLPIALLLIALWWLYQYSNAATRDTLKRIGLALGALFGTWLLMRINPRLLILMPLVIAALVLAYRRWPAPTPSNPNDAAQRSTVTTQYLIMTLNHDTGAIFGEVRSGRFNGRQLSDLNSSELIELYRECLSDQQSAAVLESFLDRTLQDWRDIYYQRYQTSAYNDDQIMQGTMKMDEYEARAILGVPADASADAIKAAHRRLIQRLHPDQGGSDYLAARINHAKDVLLGD